MNGMPVRLTEKRTGYTMEGIYKTKTSDCHVVQTSTGTDTLFKMDDWDCQTIDEAHETNPFTQLARAVDRVTRDLSNLFKIK